MNKEEKKKELIKIIFTKKLKLSKITQLSWSISQLERLYPLSGTEEDLKSLLDGYESIWRDFITLAKEKIL